MRRPYSFARGSHIPSATINRIMDEATGLIRATGAPSGALAFTGEDGRSWTTPDVGVPNGDVVVVDASVNWQSRTLHGVFVRLTAAAQRAQGVDAWKRNDPTQAFAVRTFDDGWTGVNAAPITTTPTLGAGVFAVLLDELSAGADRIWLFARSTDGALCLLNDSGATLHAELRVWGSGTTASAGTAPSVPGLLAGEVDTTDATWTTVPGCTATLAASSTVTFRGMVSAIRSTGAEGAAFTLEAAFRRPATGDPVLVGSALYPLVARDDATFDVRIQVVGSDVVVQVHGAASKTLTWRAEIDTTEARIS